MPPHHMWPRDASRVEGHRLDRGVLIRVWSFARPYRRAIGGFLAAIVTGALLGLVAPLLFRSIIDDALPAGDRGHLTFLAGIVALAAIVRSALGLGERYLSARIGEGLIFDLRVVLFDHVQRMPLAFFTRSQTGALISRLNNDVIGAQRALTGTLGSVVSNTVVLATTVSAMIALEWRLTLLALALLPVFMIPARRVGSVLAAISRRQMELNAEMNSTMTERFAVGGSLLVKLFGRHDEERSEFSGRAAGVRDAGIRIAVISRVFYAVMGLVGALGVVAVYWVGGNLVIDGAISLGTLVALAALVTRIYEPLNALTNARVDVMTAMVSFERVFEVLDLDNPITDKPDATGLSDVDGEVTFDSVAFTYPAAGVTLDSLQADSLDEPERHDPVLHDISLSIPAGETWALVGPSGAGKTTLAGLIPRLYDVDTGSVRVDGIDVRDVTQASLRAAVGVVSQDPHLFHTSIEENLRLARPGATQAEIVAACRAAQIHDVILGLPSGYRTVVGERGYRLSGGEKQRLSIARMLLKDPAVVILDEATSHLDVQNEAAIQTALDQVLAGRTAVVIAHRLSTIVDADRIVVVDAGRVVAHGTHPELLAAGGLYAELYRRFSRRESVPA